MGQFLCFKAVAFWELAVLFICCVFSSNNYVFSYNISFNCYIIKESIFAHLDFVIVHFKNIYQSVVVVCNLNIYAAKMNPQVYSFYWVIFPFPLSLLKTFSSQVDNKCFNVIKLIIKMAHHVRNIQITLKEVAIAMYFL